jgi:hypothetical protein
LRFVNCAVAVIGYRLEYHIGRKTIGMPLKREELRNGLEPFNLILEAKI